MQIESRVNGGSWSPVTPLAYQYEQINDLLHKTDKPVQVLIIQYVDGEQHEFRSGAAEVPN